MTTRRNFLAGSAAGLWTLGSTACAGSWNQWRGPQRDGSVPGEASWPDQLSEDRLTELWKIPLGPSYSGSIIADGRIYTTETIEEKSESVSAYAIDSGKLLWKQQWAGAMKVPFFAATNGSWIRSTPAWADGRLLVAGMRDVLVCVDAESGEIAWQNDLVANGVSQLESFGFVCSPLIDDGHAYVQTGGGLLKLQMETGKVVWKTLEDSGGMTGGAFSSPTIASIGGLRQLVVQTRSRLCGVSFDGEVLWQVDIPAFRGMNILTPTVVGDAVFTSSYRGGSFLFDITRSDDGLFRVNERWKNRVQGYMSSPVVVDGHVYLHLRNQRFTCLDLASGEQKWSSTPFGKYWSMILQGDQALALDERGDLLLLKLNPQKFEIVGQHQVADNAWAYLAISNDLLVIRNLDWMKAVRWS